MMKRNGRIRCAAMVAALSVVSFAARAETIKLKATLDAATEVPPKTSSGTGTVTATLDTATEVFTYHIEFRDLTGPAVAAHFHGPAAVGVNAGPQVPIKTKPIVSPIDGTATLTADQAKDLLDGKWYFNVHTAANPGGEIRGQVMKVQ
ncbi:MAG: CHRD domain-containing protein [Acidobacteriaceae bacterium]